MIWGLLVRITAGQAIVPAIIGRPPYGVTLGGSLGVSIGGASGVSVTSGADVELT